MLPVQWRDRLRLPVIAAPMTDVSGPGLVAAASGAGVIGAFPAHNAADSATLGRWLREIADQAGELAGRAGPGREPAPVAVNLIAHRSNARLGDDLREVIRGGAEIVVASVGSPAAIVGPLHEAGIAVLADVATLRHVERAREAGADGVVLLSAGAGGQTGRANPVAFARAVRARYDGIVVAAGGISDGAGVLAALALGADLAYLGTRFIATGESLASPAYRAAVVEATLDDVATSTQVTGLEANVLTEWLRHAGPDAADGGSRGGPGGAFSMDRLLATRGVWAAGHSADGIREVMSVADVVRRLEQELRQARGELDARWHCSLDAADYGGA